jgi:hypothetical protein
LDFWFVLTFVEEEDKESQDKVKIRKPLVIDHAVFSLVPHSLVFFLLL